MDNFIDNITPATVMTCADTHIICTHSLVLCIDTNPPSYKCQLCGMTLKKPLRETYVKLDEPEAETKVMVYPSKSCDSCYKKVEVDSEGKPQDYAIYFMGYEYGEPKYVCADCLVEDYDDQQIEELKKAIGRREKA